MLLGTVCGTEDTRVFIMVLVRLDDY